MVTKQGHSCFFCLCDMRKAVIFVNSFNIVLQSIRFVIIMLAVAGVIHSNELRREAGIEGEISPATAYAVVVIFWFLSIGKFVCI